jgi:NCS1 family nucleobase:cation symporter-1
MTTAPARAFEEALSSSRLHNDDLAPTPPSAKTWTARSYATLWIAMSCCIPTYMLASGLIASGMSWGQALLTIALGNMLVLAPILLNSHPGARYGIPFPVFARASFGVWGANVPALMRALVACGWFGINAWIGGSALHTLATAIWPGWATMAGTVGGIAVGMWLAFALFWASNIWIVYRGMEALKRFEAWAAPFVLLMTAGLVVWAVQAAHGLGPVMAQPGRYPTWAAFWPVFVPSLTAMVGFWATLSLNMPDFTRFAADQRAQMRGQVLGLPTTMTLFSAMGIVITSASTLVFGRTHWDPVKLVGEFQNVWVVALAMTTVVIATLSVNIAANVVSPANDFANVAPKRIDFKTGGLITGLLGIAIMPWRLLADAQSYIFDWLLTYSGGLGSIAGVMIVDYWVQRRCHLVVADLYAEQGLYTYWRGWNPAALLAAGAGCFAAWGGKVLPAMAPLVPYGWFVGFGVAGLVYALVNRPRAGV